MTTGSIAAGIKNGLYVLTEGDKVGQLEIGGGSGANGLGAGRKERNAYCVDN